MDGIDRIDGIDGIDSIDRKEGYNEDKMINMCNMDNMGNMTNIGGNKKKSKQVELPCSKCGKVMKSTISYNNHVKKQVCYGRNELTYCKVCDKTLPTHIDYVNHLISIEHFNQIGCDKLEVLNKKETPQILTADPYLTNNEAQHIGGHNLGNKYTFIYNNKETKTINLINTDKNENKNNVIIDKINNKSIRGNGNVHENANENIKTSISNMENVFIPTERQVKLFGLLNKPETIEAKCTLLYRLLLSDKMNENDYKGIYHIIKSSISDPGLLKHYMEQIQKFIMLLCKERNNGKTEFRGMDINKIVLNLSG